MDPAGEEYVVGAPFFESVRIRLPAGAKTGGADGEEHEVVISAPGAPTKPFVKGLWVDGRRVERAVLRHGEIVGARRVEFEMSEVPTDWGMVGV